MVRRRGRVRRAWSVRATRSERAARRLPARADRAWRFRATRSALAARGLPERAACARRVDSCSDRGTMDAPRYRRRWDVARARVRAAARWLTAVERLVRIAGRLCGGASRPGFRL